MRKLFLLEWSRKQLKYYVCIDEIWCTHYTMFLDEIQMKNKKFVEEFHVLKTIEWCTYFQAYIVWNNQLGTKEISIIPKSKCFTKK